ncbi:MAG: hypothetical protein K8T25_00235 [Planctomycetia bacterium]|nr:hypothetical protein [Planctomycetia bacterium]
MDALWESADDTAQPKQVELPKPMRGTPARFKKTAPRNAPRIGGMHQRRDKRFPFANRSLADLPPSSLPGSASATAPLAADPLMPWKEAVMLWLSWNSTYEKLTAKMCKPGQDQAKLEILMDEMDQLRKRAIELSEKLIG